MQKTHELKTDPIPFNQSWHLVKPYEIRIDDRDYQVGDKLILRETTCSAEARPRGKQLRYTGRAVVTKVISKLKNNFYGLHKDWCILGVEFKKRAEIYRPDKKCPLIGCLCTRFEEQVGELYCKNCPFIKEEVDELWEKFKENDDVLFSQRSKIAKEVEAWRNNRGVPVPENDFNTITALSALGYLKSKNKFDILRKRARDLARDHDVGQRALDALIETVTGKPLGPYEKLAMQFTATYKSVLESINEDPQDAMLDEEENKTAREGAWFFCTFKRCCSTCSIYGVCEILCKVKGEETHLCKTKKEIFKEILPSNCKWVEGRE